MRKSFILHNDSLNVLDILTDEQAGKLFKAIRNYQNGVPQELDFGINIAFVQFENQFKRDEEKYESVVERNKINGSKGGRPKNPKKPKETQNNPLGFLETQNNQTEPKKADSDSKNDNDSKKEIKEKVHTLLPLAESSIPQCDIDRFNHYSSWAAENSPKLLKIAKPLTATQLLDIRSKYSIEQFKEICLAMEAKKDFLKRYDNLNLTMRSWLKRQFGEGGNSEPPPKVPLQKGIQMPKLVTPVVNFEDAI